MYGCKSKRIVSFLVLTAFLFTSTSPASALVITEDNVQDGEYEELVEDKVKDINVLDTKVNSRSLDPQLGKIVDMVNTTQDSFYLTDRGYLLHSGRHESVQIGADAGAIQTSKPAVTTYRNVEEIFGDHQNGVFVKLKGDDKIYFTGDDTAGATDSRNYAGNVEGSHEAFHSLDEKVKMVEGTNRANLVITESGSLYAVGTPLNYIFGLPNNDELVYPTKLVSSGVVDVDMSDPRYSSAYIDTSKNLYVAGKGIQIGTSSTSSIKEFTKVLSNVVDVSLGSNHSAALLADGTVMMTGDSAYYQLGSASTTDVTKKWASSPIGVRVNQICAGDMSTYAIDTNGNLWICGKNSNGQLGIGQTSSTYKTAWTQVPKSIIPDRVLKVQNTGSSRTVVLTETGRVYMAGMNANDHGFVDSKLYTFSEVDMSSAKLINNPTHSIENGKIVLSAEVPNINYLTGNDIRLLTKYNSPIVTKGDMVVVYVAYDSDYNFSEIMYATAYDDNEILPGPIKDYIYANGDSMILTESGEVYGDLGYVAPNSIRWESSSLYKQPLPKIKEIYSNNDFYLTLNVAISEDDRLFLSQNPGLEIGVPVGLPVSSGKWQEKELPTGVNTIVDMAVDSTFIVLLGDNGKVYYLGKNTRYIIDPTATTTTAFTEWVEEPAVSNVKAIDTDNDSVAMLTASGEVYHKGYGKAVNSTETYNKYATKVASNMKDMVLNYESITMVGTDGIVRVTGGGTRAYTYGFQTSGGIDNVIPYNFKNVRVKEIVSTSEKVYPYNLILGEDGKLYQMGKMLSPSAMVSMSDMSDKIFFTEVNSALLDGKSIDSIKNYHSSLVIKDTEGGIYSIWDSSSMASPKGYNTLQKLTFKDTTTVAIPDPVITLSNYDWTNKDVTATVTSPGYESYIQYSLDGATWSSYVDPLTLTQKTNVYAKVVKDGNESGVVEAEALIDKELPTIDDMVIEGKKVTLTAHDALSGLGTNAYSYGGVSSNSNEHTFSDYGSHNIEVRDRAGNVAKVVAILEPDPTPPDVTLSKNPTEWTDGSVTVTAVASDDKPLPENPYSWDDGFSWTSSPEHVANTNKIVSVKVRDSDGLYATASIDVNNIDVIPPNVTLSSSDKTVTVTASDSQSGLHSEAYSYDKGITWVSNTSNSYTTGGVKEVWVRDKVGNVSMNNTIDLGTILPAPLAPVINRVGNDGEEVTLTITSSNTQTVTYEYKLNDGTWQPYTGPIIVPSTITETQTYVARAINEEGSISPLSNIVTINPLTINVIVPMKIPGTINVTSDTPYYTAPEVAIENRGKPVSVMALRMSSNTDEFRIVAPNAKDWNKLGLRGTRSSMAFSINDQWFAGEEDELNGFGLGIMSKGSRKPLNVKAKHGFAFTASEIINHELIIRVE